MKTFSRYIYFFVLVLSVMSFKFNQIKLELNNSTGVPFTKDNMGLLHIEGFDIDSGGRMYIFGGKTPTLICYQNSKFVYSKRIINIEANPLYVSNNNIFIYDNKYNKNTLYLLNSNNANVVKKQELLLKQKVNSWFIYNDTIVFEIMTNPYIVAGKRKYLKYYVYTTDGKFVRETKNRYDLNNNIMPNDSETLYLGRWHSNYVFWDYDLDKRQYILSIRSEGSNKQIVRCFDESKFGNLFGDNGQESIKLRNNIVYTIGYAKGYAIITEIPLTDL